MKFVRTFTIIFISLAMTVYGVVAFGQWDIWFVADIAEWTIIERVIFVMLVVIFPAVIATAIAYTRKVDK